MTIPDYGSDFYAFDDLDANLTFLSTTSEQVYALAQSTARRLFTPTGGLFYDTTFGFDIRTFLSGTTTPDIASKQITSEARRDDRIANVITTIVVSGETWNIKIVVTPSNGPTFTLTASVSRLSVDKVSMEIVNADA